MNSVKKLLSGQVNEILGEIDYPIPPIEFDMYRGGSAVVSVIGLSTCERSEKERIVRLDAYTLIISFSLPETPENEVCGCAYAIDRTLAEDSVLGYGSSRSEK